MRNNSGYSISSRLLHRAALQSNAIAEMSFDVENASINKRNKAFASNHVFISGLARSGTTILMQYLHQTGKFRSLTYWDMPFVLMPNTWKKLRGNKPEITYKERAHQDGIMVGYDSPEAFEEVFWRVFSGNRYIGKDRLQPYTINNNLQNKFKDYINNILLSADTTQQTRYLSKNNNNILRLPYLKKCFPDAKIIIPFRDPLQQAASLLAQHLHFTKLQTEDKFSLDYMNWLGHFEFGLNQKPFFFNDAGFALMTNYENTDINFWLLNWKNYYQYVIDNYTKTTILFNYERFCQQPLQVMAALFEQLSIDAPVVKYQSFNPVNKMIAGADECLLEQCNAIYLQLF